MSFDFTRLSRADQIVGGSAVAFFIALFLFKWYGGSVSAPAENVSFGTSLNGWHAFHNSRWIWLVTIIVAVGATAVAGGVLELRGPVPPSVAVAALGALSTVLVAYRILHHPSGGSSATVGGVHLSSSYGIKLGIWLGLIAAAGIAYGGWLGMRDDGFSFAGGRGGGAAAA